jgi:hypothetical protein
VPHTQVWVWSVSGYRLPCDCGCGNPLFPVQDKKNADEIMCKPEQRLHGYAQNNQISFPFLANMAIVIKTKSPVTPLWE